MKHLHHSGLLFQQTEDIVEFSNNGLNDNKSEIVLLFSPIVLAPSRYSCEVPHWTRHSRHHSRYLGVTLTLRLTRNPRTNNTYTRIVILHTVCRYLQTVCRHLHSVHTSTRCMYTFTRCMHASTRCMHASTRCMYTSTRCTSTYCVHASTRHACTPHTVSAYLCILYAYPRISRCPYLHTVYTHNFQCTYYTR